MDFFMSAVSELPSADLDARWLKKGGSCHFVCKVFVRTDEEGFLDRVLACPATRARHPRFSAMVAVRRDPSSGDGGPLRWRRP